MYCGVLWWERPALLFGCGSKVNIPWTGVNVMQGPATVSVLVTVFSGVLDSTDLFL